MTTEIFNALPIEARRFIENEIGCLSCGQKKDLDYLLLKYNQMKNSNLYIFRNGAVSFFDKKEQKRTILYPLSDSDTDEETKEKLKNALKVNEVRPESFLKINVEEIKAILKPKKEIKVAE